MGRHVERMPVTLSAAKGLARRTQRSLAALRMTARTPLTASHISKCLSSIVLQGFIGQSYYKVTIWHERNACVCVEIGLPDAYNDETSF